MFPELLPSEATLLSLLVEKIQKNEMNEEFLAFFSNRTDVDTCNIKDPDQKLPPFYIDATKGQLLALVRKGLLWQLSETSYRIEPAAFRYVAAAGKSEEAAESLLAMPQQMVLAFNLDEIKTICFACGIDYEELPHSDKRQLSLALVSETNRRGSLSDLIAICHRLAPNFLWPDIDD